MGEQFVVLTIVFFSLWYKTDNGYLSCRWQFAENKIKLCFVRFVDFKLEINVELDEGSHKINYGIKLISPKGYRYFGCEGINSWDPV